MELPYELIIDTLVIPERADFNSVMGLPTDVNIDGDGIYAITRKPPVVRLHWLGRAASLDEAAREAERATLELGLQPLRFLPTLVGKLTIASRLGLSPNTISEYAKDRRLPAPFHAPAGGHPLYLWADVYPWAIETRGRAKLGLRGPVWFYLAPTLDELDRINHSLKGEHNA